MPCSAHRGMCGGRPSKASALPVAHTQQKAAASAMVSMGRSGKTTQAVEQWVLRRREKGEGEGLAGVMMSAICTAMRPGPCHVCKVAMPARGTGRASRLGHGADRVHRSMPAEFERYAIAMRGSLEIDAPRVTEKKLGEALWGFTPRLSKL